MSTKIHLLTVIDHLKGNIISCTDASDLGIGAVLMQVKKIVAYESHKLNIVELKYPIHEKRLFAMIHLLKFWRYYLLEIKFKIEPNHVSLRYLSI